MKMDEQEFEKMFDKVLEKKIELKKEVNEIPSLKIGETIITYKPETNSYDIEAPSDTAIGIDGCGRGYKPWSNGKTFGCKLDDEYDYEW